MPDEHSRTRRSGAATGLRTAAVWATLAELTSKQASATGRPLRVLDIGGGTGGMAVPLAQAGHAVTVLDPSPDALASLRRRAAESEVEVRALQGDTDSVQATCAGDAPFDLVCLHGVLEVADDPADAIAQIVSVLAPDGVVSLVVAGRLSAVLGRALAGDFDGARAILQHPDGRRGEQDRGPRHYDESMVLSLLASAGLVAVDTHGVRIFSDHVPSHLVDSEGDRRALLALEEAAMGAADQPLLHALGAALHVLARRG